MAPGAKRLLNSKRLTVNGSLLQVFTVYYLPFIIIFAMPYALCSMRLASIVLFVVQAMAQPFTSE
jgi:hypothetical protein